MKKVLTPMLCLFLFCGTACQEDNAPQLNTESVVVEAYLYAGQVVDNIKITQSKSNSNEDTSLVTLDDLQIVLSQGADTFPLNPVGEGLYQNLQVQVESNATYTLSFTYNDRTISSDTYVPDHREVSISTTEVSVDKIELGTFPNFGDQPDPIELEWENEEGDYYYVVVENIEEDPEIINELLANAMAEGLRFQFISEPEVMDFYGIDTRREIQQFGMHQIVVFRVNPEYAALYETAGSTSTTIAQPPSNINNGLGLFTGVSSDTLYLNVKKR